MCSHRFKAFSTDFFINYWKKKLETEINPSFFLGPSFQGGIKMQFFMRVGMVGYFLGSDTDTVFSHFFFYTL